MSLIALCVFCTEENGKLKYLKETLGSLFDTVDFFNTHRLIIINNSQYQPTIDWLNAFKDPNLNWTVLHQSKNLGTAEGINLALKQRNPGEYVVKCDDDLTWCSSGWVEEMERVVTEHPEIGILGLRRDDVYGELIEDGELLWNKDIMGTCTMYNPAMLDKVGRLVQCSPQYGYDDCIYSVRSIAAGFKNAFMKNIKIINLDEGGTEYTEWKKREAGLYASEVASLMQLIENGELSYFYPFE